MAQPAQLRVVSLLPSATDIVISLDLQHLLVGRSHEASCATWPSPPSLPACCAPFVLTPALLRCVQCDWAGLQHLPAVTSSRLGDSIPVEEIDAVMVRAC